MQCNATILLAFLLSLLGLNNTDLGGTKDAVLDLPSLYTHVHDRSLLKLLTLGTLLASQSCLRHLVKSLMAVGIESLAQALKLLNAVLG
jgi:hypothetical protein